MSSPHNKNIDVGCFVALGDSITSGYADGALYYSGQQNSFVNIMARQYKLIGGGNFKQPLVAENSVGTNADGKSRLVLHQFKNSGRKHYLELSYLASAGDAEIFSSNNYNSYGPFNNMGVPGAKIISLVKSGYGNKNNGEGNYNPFFTRMASNPDKPSILDDACVMNPTFFSLYIGNNDALAYALSGGLSDEITPLTGAVGIGFESSLDFILQELTKRNAKGVIGNIPDITSIPYFTTLPYNGLLKQTLNSARPMENGELILSDILLEPDRDDYLSGKLPIPKKYYLTIEEISKIQNAITAYNHVIKLAAHKFGLAFVDVNSMMKNSKTERFYNEKSHHLSYKKRGIFSLDGLHPNPFGQALLANEFIKAINLRYGCAISLVDSKKYVGNAFPEK